MDSIDAIMYRRNYRLVYYLLKNRYITEYYLEDKNINSEIFNEGNPYLDTKTKIIIDFFKKNLKNFKLKNFILLKETQKIKTSKVHKNILAKIKPKVFKDAVNNFLN